MGIASKKNVTPDPVKLMQIINTGFPSNIFYLVKIQIKVHEKIFGRTHETKSPYMSFVNGPI